MWLHIIYYLLFLNKQIQHYLFVCANIVAILHDTPFSFIKRYKWKLQASKRRHRAIQIARNQGPRNQGDILTVDTYERAGLFADDFEDIFEALHHSIIAPRGVTRPKKITPTSLSPRFRLLLAFDYLRNGPKYGRFVPIYHISISQIKKVT